MNREDIIRMAREAGLHYSGRCTLTGMESHIERFASLVAKHTLANIDPSSFMSWQEGYEAGKQNEREACAKVADGWPDYDVQGLAEAIRARKQA